MRRSISSLVLICCTLLLLVGCGPQQATAPTPHTTGSVDTPSTTAHTPTVANHTTSTPTTTSVTATSVSTTVPNTPTTTGPVMLILSRTHYAPSDTITVTINNNLSTSISATDHQSGCTVLTLQKQASNGAWQDQAPCREGVVTRLITLKAASAQVFNLSPTTGTFARNAIWQAGTYRIVFNYTSGNPDAVTLINVIRTPVGPVYSITFTIS